MNTAYIYGLFDPETKLLRYIGRTRNPEQRLYQHLYQHRNWKGDETHKIHWLSFLLERGLEPEMEILDECPEDDIEELKRLEEFYINYFKFLGAPLTNGTPKSFGVVSHTPETIAKMADIQKNRKAEINAKISNTLKGRKMSPEAYASLMKKVNSPKWKARMSKIHKGKKLTEEQKQHLRSIKLGVKRSPDFCRKVSAALKGKPKSPEMIAKLAEINRNRVYAPQTEEHKANRRAAFQKAMERRKQSQLDTQPQEAVA